MSTAEDIAAIQACVVNRLDTRSIGNRRVAGVIGEAPSRYSKSPALWNAAFATAGMNATYLPFDIEQAKLNDFSAVLRGAKSLMGINVTVPHKRAIMDYLDGLDPGAARIRAVNTVVRTDDGRLIGYNTDGAGFVASILNPQPERSEGFVASLSSADVLLLGAGGSARAVAFHVSELLNGGNLIICNRTVDHGRALAEELRAAGFRAAAIGEDQLSGWAPKASLIVNCTTKGQGGAFSLECYSALAPAGPLSVGETGSAELGSSDSGRPAAEAAVRRNHEASLRLASAIPKSVRFYDLIYFPEETVFLRHARTTGHQTMNGKAMIVCQAAIAFCSRICRAELHARRLDEGEIYARILASMYTAW